MLLALFLIWSFLPQLRLKSEVEQIFGNSIRFLGTLTVAWNITKVLSLLEKIVFNRFDVNSANNLKNRKVQTQFQFVKKMLSVLVWTVGISLALMTFEPARKVGASLLASAGLASVFLGFAAQKSISNLLAGFQIAFTQPIRIDDVVVIENEWGRIEEITLTYVVVELWDLRRLIVPITYFLEKPFTNWTRSSSEILGTVFVHVDYAVPIDDIRDEFNRLLKESPFWNGKVSSLVVFDATDKTVQLRAIMSADDASHAFDLRCHIREGLITFLQKNFPTSFPTVRFSSTNQSNPVA